MERPVSRSEVDALGPEVSICVIPAPQVPWEDLRYLFGEIMYGGHITDDWDRRLCRVYLEELMNPSLVRGGTAGGNCHCPEAYPWEAE